LSKKDAFHLYYDGNRKIDEIASIFRKSTRTIYRWIREIKSGDNQKQKVKRKRARKYPAHIFKRIIELKRELPKRTALNIHFLLKKEYRHSCPSIHLVRKYIASQGLNKKDPNYKKGYVKFERDRPNDLWQIDIAGVQWVGTLGKVYLHAILDDCTRFIVAAKYYKDQQGINIFCILRDAFEGYGRPNQILADNGRQFRNAIGELGTKYSRLLTLLDIQPIFASPHHPQTKGKLERWFGTVIKSFLNERKYQIEQNPNITLDKFNQLFSDWLYWYNFKKPHRSLLKSSPPAELYFKHPKRIYRPLNTVIDWNRWILSKGKGKSQNIIQFLIKKKL